MSSRFLEHASLLKSLVELRTNLQFKQALRVLPLAVVAAFAEAIYNLLRNEGIELSSADRAFVTKHRRELETLAGERPRTGPKSLEARRRMLAKLGVTFLARCTRPLFAYVERHGDRLSTGADLLASQPLRA